MEAVLLGRRFQGIRSFRLARAAIFAAAGAVMVIAVATNASERSLAQRNPIVADSHSITRGRAIYTHHCASCHGPAGRGDGRAGRDLEPHPTDLTKPDVARQSDLQLFRKITRGRRPMPSFARLIPEEDRWHVINFLRTLGTRTARQDND